MSISSWREIFCSKRNAFISTFIIILCAQTFSQTPVPALSNSMQASTQTSTQTLGQSVGAVLRLEDLEQMALKSNPTMAQAEAVIRAAEGKRVQSGLWPNPIVGYSGNEFALRAFGEKSEHLGFVEQTIPLGGKLKKSQAIFAQEKLQSEQSVVAQRQRIINGVRMLFYRALGAQQLVAVRTELAKLSRDAVKVTGELLNVGQADRPDVAQIRIEAERAELDLMMAENEREQVWSELAAVVGNPALKPTTLAGQLEKDLPVLNQEALLNQLLTNSPEVKRAQTGVERARAVISRAKAEVTPDLYLRGGFGYNRELLEREIPSIRKRTGLEAQVEVGLRIPIFNRNQGGIASATAELDVAEREVQRVELLLRTRFASAFRNYLNASRVASQYEKQIVPQAQGAYDMYLKNFRGMAAAYPQVLIAQRTLFQVRADYVAALVNTWQHAALLQGYLLSGPLDASGGMTMENSNPGNADDRD